MAGIQKSLETIYGSDVKEYYTGNNTDMFFNNIYVDECTSFGFRSVVNNSPTYAYNSELFNSISQGNFRVEGKFTVNFVANGYVEGIIQKGDIQRQAGTYTPLGQVSGLDTGRPTQSTGGKINLNDPEFINTAIFDPRSTSLNEAEQEQARARLRDYIWGYLDVTESAFIKSMRSVLAGQYFDILMMVGNPNSDNYDVKNFVDCQIIDVSMEVVKNMPLQMMYTFIARDTDRPSSRPNPFDYIRSDVDSARGLELGPYEMLNRIVDLTEKYTSTNLVNHHMRNRSRYGTTVDPNDTTSEQVRDVTNPNGGINITDLTSILTFISSISNTSLFFRDPSGNKVETLDILEIHSPAALTGILYDPPNNFNEEEENKSYTTSSVFEQVSFGGISIPAPKNVDINTKIVKSVDNLDVNKKTESKELIEESARKEISNSELYDVKSSGSAKDDAELFDTVSVIPGVKSSLYIKQSDFVFSDVIHRHDISDTTYSLSEGSVVANVFENSLPLSGYSSLFSTLPNNGPISDNNFEPIHPIELKFKTFLKSDLGGEEFFKPITSLTDYTSLAEYIPQTDFSVISERLSGETNVNSKQLLQPNVNELNISTKNSIVDGDVEQDQFTFTIIDVDNSKLPDGKYSIFNIYGSDSVDFDKVLNSSADGKFFNIKEIEFQSVDSPNPLNKINLVDNTSVFHRVCFSDSAMHIVIYEPSSSIATYKSMTSKESGDLFNELIEYENNFNTRSYAILNIKLEEKQIDISESLDSIYHASSNRDRDYDIFTQYVNLNRVANNNPFSSGTTYDFQLSSFDHDKVLAGEPTVNNWLGLALSVLQRPDSTWVPVNINSNPYFVMSLELNTTEMGNIKSLTDSNSRILYSNLLFTDGASTESFVVPSDVNNAVDYTSLMTNYVGKIFTNENMVTFIYEPAFTDFTGFKRINNISLNSNVDAANVINTSNIDSRTEVTGLETVELTELSRYILSTFFGINQNAYIQNMEIRNPGHLSLPGNLNDVGFYYTEVTDDTKGDLDPTDFNIVALPLYGAHSTIEAFFRPESKEDIEIAVKPKGISISSINPTTGQSISWGTMDAGGLLYDTTNPYFLLLSTEQSTSNLIDQIQTISSRTDEYKSSPREDVEHIYKPSNAYSYILRGSDQTDTIEISYNNAGATNTDYVDYIFNSVYNGVNMNNWLEMLRKPTHIFNNGTINNYVYETYITPDDLYISGSNGSLPTVFPDNLGSEIEATDEYKFTTIDINKIPILRNILYTTDNARTEYNLKFSALRTFGTDDRLYSIGETFDTTKLNTNYQGSNTNILDDTDVYYDKYCPITIISKEVDSNNRLFMTFGHNVSSELSPATENGNQVSVYIGFCTGNKQSLIEENIDRRNLHLIHNVDFRDAMEVMEDLMYAKQFDGFRYYLYTAYPDLIYNALKEGFLTELNSLNSSTEEIKLMISQVMYDTIIESMNAKQPFSEDKINRSRLISGKSRNNPRLDDATAERVKRDFIKTEDKFSLIKRDSFVKNSKLSSYLTAKDDWSAYIQGWAPNPTKSVNLQKLTIEPSGELQGGVGRPGVVFMVKQPPQELWMDIFELSGKESNVDYWVTEGEDLLGVENTKNLDFKLVEYERDMPKKTETQLTWIRDLGSEDENIEYYGDPALFGKKNYLNMSWILKKFRNRLAKNALYDNYRYEFQIVHNRSDYNNSTNEGNLTELLDDSIINIFETEGIGNTRLEGKVTSNATKVLYTTDDPRVKTGEVYVRLNIIYTTPV
jgi:hypothetical protein